MFLAGIRDKAKFVIGSESPKSPKYEQAWGLYQRIIEVLINTNLRLVVKAAYNSNRSYRSDPGFILEDSIEEAILQMYIAAETWDPSKGSLLGTYFIFIYRRGYNRARNIANPITKSTSTTHLKYHERWTRYNVLRRKNPKLSNSKIYHVLGKEYNETPYYIGKAVETYKNICV